MPEKVLTIVQYGLEAANGTAVAADTRLVANATLPDSDRDIKIPGAGIGKRVPGIIGGAHTARVGVTGLTLESDPDAGAYYQILPLLFCSLLKTVAATGPGTTADYTWAFTDPLTGTETLDTFTLEVGDSSTASYSEEVAYCIVRELELTGNAETGESSFTATIDGDEIVRTTLTTVATIPSFQAINGKLARLYIDDTWAGLGGNEVTAALLDFRLNINGGGHHKRRGSANRKPTSHGQGEIVITLEVGLERTSGVITEGGKFYATTFYPDERYVRLEIDSGVPCDGVGGGDANHKLTIDLAGVWTSWSNRGRDQDGNNIDVATLTCAYDPTGTHAFDIDLITSVAAI